MCKFRGQRGLAIVLLRVVGSEAFLAATPASPLRLDVARSASNSAEDEDSRLAAELNARLSELGLTVDPFKDKSEPDLSELNTRLAALGKDPELERMAVEAQVAESSATVVDGNELKRRYYEAFLKARHELRGGPVEVSEEPQLQPPPTARVPALAASVGAAAASSPWGGGDPWGGDQWYADAEVRHARTATFGLAYWLAVQACQPCLASQAQKAWGQVASGAASRAWAESFAAAGAPPGGVHVPAASALLPGAEGAAGGGAGAVAVAASAADPGSLAGWNWSGLAGGVDGPAASALLAVGACAVVRELFVLGNSPPLTSPEPGAGPDPAAPPAVELPWLGRFQSRLEASELLHGRVAMLIWALALGPNLARHALVLG
mmetsp:Transcript_60149/g.136004  ORF Transcript_60149/g.136004 Transcript_60149/m.136004 type:complete len:378 (-) Transcript_60149:168-1301(-)